MATYYFVREGSGDRRTNQGREISISEIATAFPDCKPIWSQAAPVFNANSPVNAVSAYRFVVVELKSEECTGKYARDGYWLLDGVSPSEFERKISS